MAFRPLPAFLAIMVALWSGTLMAHSLEELNAELHEREVYFEPRNEEAPDFRLQDTDGRIVALADLRDKVIVLHFIYASCPDVCPLHAEKIAEVQAMVNQTEMREQVQFITITTDPVRDTPEVMKAYGPAHGLDPVNWMFLTSGAEDPDTTRALAEQYGQQFTGMDDGMQMHGVVTHVIDREGRLRAKFHGLDFQPTSLLVFVNALVNDHDRRSLHEAAEPSLWDKIRALF